MRTCADEPINYERFAARTHNNVKLINVLKDEKLDRDPNRHRHAVPACLKNGLTTD